MHISTLGQMGDSQWLNVMTFLQTSAASKFDILLTVHHVMILGKWPTWCTNSFLCIYFYF
jgi:hypothetical protein